MSNERDSRPNFSHLDEQGKARMVDVGGKETSQRRAVASGRIRMNPATLEAIREGEVAKGDVLAVARVAAIQAAKETARLIPLCHPLSLDAVAVDFDLTGSDEIVVTVETRILARTGVEMEALSATAAGLLTIYDMCKAVDRGMTIDEIRLEEKQGGRSGHWKRNHDRSSSEDGD